MSFRSTETTDTRVVSYSDTREGDDYLEVYKYWNPLEWSRHGQWYL